MNKTLCLCLLAIATIFGCSGKKDTSANAPTNLKQFLAGYKGHTLVLLVGAEGCPGTARITTDMDAIAADKSSGVSLVRLDVPMPGQKAAQPGPWDHAYPRLVDADRKLADQLEFFYYPTLYVFDGDGDLRFVGGCDKVKLTEMLAEIKAQPPGEPKKIFTPPMPEIGKPVPALSGETTSGEPASLAKLSGKNGTLLVFAKTSCPFSVQAMPSIKSLAQQYASHDLSVVVINIGETKNKLDAAYKDLSPAVLVWDQQENTSKAYGTDMVPFAFLLDKDANVVARRPYTQPSATRAVNTLLGIKNEAIEEKPAGAG